MWKTGRATLRSFFVPIAHGHAGVVKFDLLLPHPGHRRIAASVCSNEELSPMAKEIIPNKKAGMPVWTSPLDLSFI